MWRYKAFDRWVKEVRRENIEYRQIKAYPSGKYRVLRRKFEECLRYVGNECEICHEPLADSTAAQLDHCHDTGRLRGFLCRKCNLKVGYFEATIEWREIFQEYLKQATPELDVEIRQRLGLPALADVIPSDNTLKEPETI